MKLMKEDNKGKVLTVLRADRQKLEIQKGIPLAGICSLPIFLPPFPLLFLPLLPPSSPPLSHHSKMLPGPVLVVIVTKTGGDFHVTGSSRALIG